SSNGLYVTSPPRMPHSILEGTQPVWPDNLEIPGRSVPDCRNGYRARGGAADGLQRRPVTNEANDVRQGSRHVQVSLFSDRREDLQSEPGALRRLRLYQGVPRRKVLSRF